MFDKSVFVGGTSTSLSVNIEQANAAEAAALLEDLKRVRDKQCVGGMNLKSNVVKDCAVIAYEDNMTQQVRFDIFICINGSNVSTGFEESMSSLSSMNHGDLLLKIHTELSDLIAREALASLTHTDVGLAKVLTKYGDNR